MLKSDVITHFGSNAKVAKALKIGRAAVGKWGDLIPPIRAAQLHKITDGHLRYDPEIYGLAVPALANTLAAPAELS